MKPRSNQDPWQATLEHLRDEVRAQMRQEGHPEPDLMARLARDYRSWVRMGHPPERAVNLARQLRFQHRDYADDPEQALALRVTELLAEIYEQELDGMR
jgi:hypothetical protein